MADDEVKAWRCRNGHVLGVVRRNSSHVAKLYLYRQAVDLETAPDEELQAVDVIAVVEGYAADARCSICGAIRSWFPNPDSVRRYLKQQDNKNKGEE